MSLVPRGPIKYPSSRAIGMTPLRAKVLPGADLLFLRLRELGGRPKNAPDF
jgi:hypothetical protein